MTDQEKTEVIAEVVMGYEQKILDGTTCYKRPDGAIRVFNPFESWADAGKVLERVRELNIGCRIRFDSEIFTATHQIPHRLTPRIISEAAYQLACEMEKEGQDATE